MLLLVIMTFCLSSWSFMTIPNIADDAFSNYDWKQVIGWWNVCSSEERNLEPCTFSPFKLLVDLYHQGRLKAKMVAKWYSRVFGFWW